MTTYPCVVRREVPPRPGDPEGADRLFVAERVVRCSVCLEALVVGITYSVSDPADLDPVEVERAQEDLHLAVERRLVDDPWDVTEETRLHRARCAGAVASSAFRELGEVAQTMVRVLRQDG